MNLKSLVEQQQKDYTSVIQQIELFRNGVHALKLIEPATINNGIHSLNTISSYTSYFESKESSFCKFVPASGAATRMFKEQFGYADSNDIDSFEKSSVFKNLKNLALYKNIEANSPHEILTELLEKFGSIPKGLIPFHKYETTYRTAFEEHFVEAAQFLSDSDELHFTVHPNYKNNFEAAWNNLPERLKFNCSFSVQNPTTDTIAVDLNNEPYLNEQNQLVFRPAGHGALIHNLNAIQSRYISVKNIDNVCHEKFLETTISTKKEISGYLIFLSKKVHTYCKALETEVSSELINEILSFIKNEFFVSLPSDSNAKELFHFLNRPIRVAGMVLNTGEPGGGPYWVEKNGMPTLQIVEMAQINTSNKNQLDVVEKATHFNPVDLALSVYNYKGEKFDLTQFVDNNEVFIAEKSINGTPIKALELPGLWNGAMSNWLTTFVEVPLETFNPVKTIGDLLRPMHQQ